MLPVSRTGTEPGWCWPDCWAVSPGSRSSGLTPLCRQADRVGLGDWRMAAAGGAPQSGQPPLRAAASPVGSGADTGFAESVPTAQQRLRRTARNQRGLGSYSDGPPDDQKTETNLIPALSHTLLGTGWGSRLWAGPVLRRARAPLFYVLRADFARLNINPGPLPGHPKSLPP